MKLGLGSNLVKNNNKGIGKSINPYQAWTTYADSPLLTADWPYQAIYESGGNYFIAITKDVIYMQSNPASGCVIDQAYKRTQWNGTSWNAPVDRSAGNVAITNWQQSNHNILLNDKATVHFAKTTA
jgi:hypothetical protein